MVHKQKQLLIGGITLFLLVVLAACSAPGSSSTANKTDNTPANTGGGSLPQQQGTPIASTATTVTTKATPVTGQTGNNGPTVITATTPVPGGNSHSQQVKLQDRILIISSVTKQAGTSANAAGISLTVTIKNTSNAAITNQSSYFQLLGSEGDVFGMQSSVTPAFSGPIPAGASRTGTIVFQVPSAATTGLRLFFRSDIAAETVIAALNM